MKVKYLIAICFIYSSFSLHAQDFYYAFEKKVFITKTDGYSLQFKEEVKLSEFKQKYSFAVIDQYSNNVITMSAHNAEGLHPYFQDAIVQSSPVYKTDDQLELILFDEIICKGNQDINNDMIYPILKDFDYTIIDKKSRFIIKIPDVNADILKLSNSLYETGYFTYCYPNFISKLDFHEYIPNDPYFGEQFYLRNTGQTLNDGHVGTTGADISAADAWDITTGNSSVVIAVIDEGVTDGHSDLPSSRQVRLNGSNFSGSGNVNDPSPQGNGNHGNACAGIVAAEQDNNEGVTGICPECRIMPIRIPFGSSVHNDLADAIDFATLNGAVIISNSWGYNSSDPNLFPVIVTAIQDAVNNGSLVVFSAGNTANHVNGNDGFVSFPANTGVAGSICVGASNRNDQQANYSPTNGLIQVVAPSHNAYPSQIAGESFEIWTIDIPGNDGYNPCNANCNSPRFLGEQLPSTGTNFLSYTGRMGGTSSSCPEVAAVAGLILSVDPLLTPIEIEQIIMNTADEVGGYNYVAGRSDEMGHGRLNAYAALLSVQICPDNLVITQNVLSGQSDIQEAKNSVIVINTIFEGAHAEYDAGNQICLKPGFHAKSGSNFWAYVEGCGNNPLPNSNSSLNISDNYIEHVSELELAKINTVNSNSNITVFPNPSQDLVNIENNVPIEDVVLRSISGIIAQWIEIEFFNSNKKAKLNIQYLPKGIYFLQIKDIEDKIYVKKIVIL